MTKQKRYLITTADERTWKFDCPVIFLGEWCRLYNRKHIWQKMDAIVAEPYGLKLSKKDSDYSETLMLEKKLFPKFCVLLNQHHCTQYSERFWQIVVGHWFKFSIRDLFNRINTIKECLLSHEISGTISYACDKYSITPTSWDIAIHAYDYETWKNNVLYTNIINLLEGVNFSTELIAIESPNFFRSFASKAKITEKKSFNRNILKLGYEIYHKISKRFVRNNDAFIINTFLPIKEETKLELALGQLPQLWKLQWNKFTQPEIVKKLPDRLLRENLTKQFINKSCNNLENIIRQLLFELLPICYLEGFVDLNNIVNEQPWPKSPKLIFTSNNFYLDEVFKLWSALKVESGTKYYIGQHGANYGTQRHKFPRIEEIISDKFITWGWTDGLPQHTPGFIFKNIGKKNFNFNPKGSLLLIEQGYTKNDSTYDKKFEYNQYLNNQRKFVSYLASGPRQELMIRLFNRNYTNDEWAEQSRWFDFDPKLKIDNGEVNIEKLTAESRLVVHSYDSTGILENMTQNIPMVAFWQNDYNNLRDNCKPYYQLLVDAGILHFSAKSVADKINMVWDDVDTWWQQSNVREARKQFCQRYAKTSQNPISELKQILLS